MIVIVFCISTLFYVAVNCQHAADFIKPCYASDKACLKTSSQRAIPYMAAGIPELNTNSLDPMKMNQVKTTQANLKMNFKNTTVKGLRNCEVLDVSRLVNQTAIDLKCSVTLVGDYILGGRLLILPIEGKGKYKIKIHDIVVKVLLDISERESHGESYWVVKDFTHKAHVLGYVQFFFQNLFNGNKYMADPVIEFSNRNWREIFNELSPPILYTIVSQIVGEIAKFFDQIPIRMMAL